MEWPQHCQRVQAEAGRRESEERYALVTEAIHEGIFDWNIVTGAYYLSPRYKEILGYRDDELPNDPRLILRAHPSRRQRAHGGNRGTLQPRPYQGPVRRRTKAQAPGRTYRWVVSRGRIVRNDQGEPIRIVGAIGDMTDRLESAAKLAASEKRLRDILDSLFGFVGLFTLDGRVIECQSRAAGSGRPESWRTYWASSLWETYWLEP